MKSKIHPDGTPLAPGAKHRTGACAFRRAERSHFYQRERKKILPPKKNYQVYFISLPISLLPQSMLLLLSLLLLIVLPRTCGSPGSISLLWAEGRRETGRREVSRRAQGKRCTGGQSSAQQLWAHLTERSAASEPPPQYVRLTGDPGPAAECHFP